MTLNTWIAVAVALVALGAIVTFGSKYGLFLQPAVTPGGAGAHCGGFIQNAPTCAAGYHCQLKISNPDTGGTCVKD